MRGSDHCHIAGKRSQKKPTLLTPWLDLQSALQKDAFLLFKRSTLCSFVMAAAASQHNDFNIAFILNYKSGGYNSFITWATKVLIEKEQRTVG